MAEFTPTVHNLSLVLYGAALLVSLVGLGARSRWGTGAGVALAWGGLLAQGGLLVVRWAAVGYLPVTGLFSTLHFLTLWLVGAALYFVHRYRAQPFLPAALTLGLAALVMAGRGRMELMPLVPALDTPLFFLHVATSFAAYGLFTAGALVGMYRALGIPGSRLGQERRMLDECLYVGYILFSWCMIAGSLWAYLAWGSYWTWRIKGLWSTVLWFYYSGVIHVRTRPGWQGRPLDLLALVGFGLVLFTFLGLGLLFETSHPLA
ncbi:MAG TPA: cytochrome c biogenesis protein CcsA [Deferrisomatales bacterium]|nr:cytochrome c biogenesis protein CcsA [Deferrisomatales bacterium]